MALEVATMATSKACMLHVPTHFSFRKKLNSPNSQALKPSKLSRSSSAPSSYSPISRKCQSSVICKARSATDEVTDSSWNSLVVESPVPVLVDFWAPWCGPCKLIEPVIDELAKEYAGKITCYKLNTDNCPTIVSQYGIRSIPTVLFFKNGEKKESIIGAVPKSTFTATIEKYLDQ